MPPRVAGNSQPMNPNASGGSASVGQGRLLGVNGLNRAAQRLEQAADKLASGLGASPGFTTRNFGFDQGNGSAGTVRAAVRNVWNGPAPRGTQWGPIGGGARFSQPVGGGNPRYNQGGTYNQMPPFQTAPPGGNNRWGSQPYSLSNNSNGGGGQFTGAPFNQGGGSAPGLPSFGGGLKGMWKGMVDQGNRMMPTQNAMDTYVTWATIGQANQNNYAAARKFAYGANNGGLVASALNTQDATQGAVMAQQIGGWSPGNPTNQSIQATLSARRQFGMTSPWLGAAGSMRAYAAMNTSGSYYRGLAMGLGPSIGANGAGSSPGQQLREMVSGTFQGRSRLSQREIDAAVSQRGSLRANLMTRYGDSSTVEANLTLFKAQQAASRSGMSDSDFDALLKKAESGDKGAQQTLEKKGIIKRSALQGMKNVEATRTGRSADVNKDFSDSVIKATDAVDAMSKSLTGFINNVPGMKAFIGMSGGASVLNSSLQSMGNALAIGSPVFGMAKRIFGGSGSDPGGQTMTALATAGKGGGSNVQNSQGTNAGSVLSQMLKMKGWPYIWGGESPGEGGFDCSGIVDWALHQVGYPGIKGQRLTTYNAQSLLHAKKVSIKDVVPGDIVMPSSMGHMEMYAGGGKTVGSRGGKASRTPGVGEYVMGSRFDFALRFLDKGGTIGDSGNNSTANPAATTNNGTGGGSISGLYGSQEEVDALMSALAGGGGGGGGLGGNAKDTSKVPNGTSGGSGGTPSGTGFTPASAKALGKAMAAQRGWGSQAEWNALLNLWNHESNWNWKAANPHSTARGIPQALVGGRNGHNMATDYGGKYKDFMSNPTSQIGWGLDYIKSRYHDPVGAWSWWQGHNSYGQGGWEVQQDERAQIHKGEMVIPARQAETIRSALLKDALIPKSGQGGAGSSGGGTHLQFGAGAVVIQVQGALNDASARQAAQAFADELSKQSLYAKIAAGVTNSGQA